MIQIYTLNGYKNFGNRLQLFALSKILKLKHPKLKVSTYWPKNSNDKLKELLKYRTPLKYKYPKESKLSSFTRKYTPIITKHTRYDCAIIGSDQVWNPEYLATRPFLLNVPGRGKKISYASSIGFSKINEAQKKEFKEALKMYSAISVREQSAKELLQPLTDKRIEVVLDPTLLLDVSEYEALEKKPKGITGNENYVLCYILGDRDHEATIEKFANEKGYKTIYFSDKRDSNYGVEEFLYLIHHAQLVCTDSFHASVFSFIFERPFVAFKRTGEADYMYTRLQNLIDTFQLKNREFNGKEITEKNLEVDYDNAKKVLERERKKSLNFLKKALGIIDEK